MLTLLNLLYFSQVANDFTTLLQFEIEQQIMVHVITMLTVSFVDIHWFIKCAFNISMFYGISLPTFSVECTLDLTLERIQSVQYCEHLILLWKIQKNLFNGPY